MKSAQRRLAFYALSLLLIAILTTVMPGCGASSSQGTSNQYTITPGRVNNFYVVSSDLDPARKPRYIEYLFTGTIKNNTANIYASVYIKMRVSIELGNGNVLEEKDLNDIPFNNILSNKSIQNWKPGQAIEVNRLVSISIPIEYADYPVKDVIIQYTAKLENKINQTQEEDVIASVSVIDKWQTAVKKVRIGRADSDDGNFPNSILNGKPADGLSVDNGKKELIDE
ncbi:MAG: hypothetical protein BGO55_24075 [Sphingobacteriales bacterium 50-39]|nr:hypothetical protein [Sphingobacteriales bacterium]OJW58377.1 MAG: hypothetical protein BGO55_24075 [Sphingobacteriales bacterium 50-39]